MGEVAREHAKQTPLGWVDGAGLGNQLFNLVWVIWQEAGHERFKFGDGACACRGGWVGVCENVA